MCMHVFACVCVYEGMHMFVYACVCVYVGMYMCDHGAGEQQCVLESTTHSRNAITR